MPMVHGENSKHLMDQAEKAAREIISDLADRSGLGNEWDQIEKDIQEEILDTWTDIIRKASTDGM